MKVKINKLLETDVNLGLPVVFEYVDGIETNNLVRKIEVNFVMSSFYQTSKMKCQPFYKTKYLKELNDR